METFFQIQTEFGNGRIGKNVVRYRRWLTVCVRGFLRLSRTLLFFHISWIWKISWDCLLWASAMDGPFVRVEVIMIYFYGLYMLRLFSIALTTEKDALSYLLQTKWPLDTKRKGNSEKKNPSPRWDLNTRPSVIIRVTSRGFHVHSKMKISARVCAKCEIRFQKTTRLFEKCSKYYF